MIPSFVIKGLIVAAVVAAFGFWAWTGGKASERKDWLVKEAAQVAAQLAATEAARATEQAWQTKLNEAQHNGKLEKDKAARVIAGLRLERDGLRQSITGFTSVRPDDTSETYRERCTATGSLLQEALRVSEACADDGERISADLRSVLAAWPAK
jgi:type II secretory pathway pseudopilin PulG